MAPNRHRLRNLPPIDTQGRVDIEPGSNYPTQLNLARSSAVHLPADLTIAGDLNISHSAIVELPPGLTVQGCLIAQGSRISTLPADLKVRGGVADFSHSTIEDVPGGLTFPGTVTLSNCRRLRSISPELQCSALNLSHSGIAELPLMKRWPLWLKLGWSDLQQLPDDIDAPRLKLDVRHTKLRRLPRRMRVDRLMLDGTEVDAIPDDLKVGQLVLGSAPVSRFPVSMTIQSLVCSPSTRAPLPLSLRFQHPIWKEPPYEGGALSLAGCKQYTWLPRELVGVSHLDLQRSAIAALPDGLRLEYLDLSETLVAALPAALGVGTLVMRNMIIPPLPTGMFALRRIDFSGSVIGPLDNIVSCEPPKPVTSIIHRFRRIRSAAREFNSQGRAMTRLCSLKLCNATLETLPEGTCVEWEIDLTGAKIDRLPQSLSCGSLILKGSTLKQLPNGLRIENELDISDTAITELPEGLSLKRLTMRNAKVKRLPPGFAPRPTEHLKGFANLDFDGSAIEELPSGLCASYLSLRHTPLDVLPEDLHVETLMLWDTRIENIPETSKIRFVYLPRGFKGTIPDGTHIG